METGGKVRVLCADRAVTGDGTTMISPAAVAISESTGAILGVGSREQVCSRFHGEVVEFDGCTILPGLIDLHVHLSGWDHRPFGYAGGDFSHAYVTLRNARKAFQMGVTTIRSVADKNGLVASLVWADENGILDEPIPRIIPCGNGICMTGGHGSEFPEGGDIADGPWEVRRRVRKNLQDGAQWIKLLTSKREFIPEFTQEELDAAVDECHRRNRKIAVHSGVPVTIQMCIDAGVDTIEHGTYMSVEQAEEMKRKGIAWVPTAMVYSEHAKQAEEAHRKDAAVWVKARDAYRDNLRKLYDTGVLVGAGTDVSVDEFNVITYRELEYMVEYGLTPLEAIQAGTQNGAKILDLQDVTGTLAEGLEADLLVVSGNPAEQIGDLKNVKSVWKHGVNVYTACQ